MLQDALFQITREFGCRHLPLTNRTETIAAAVAAALEDLLPGGRCRTIPWTPEALRRVLPDIDLIINGTSLGMSPDDPVLLPEGTLTPVPGNISLPAVF